MKINHKAGYGYGPRATSHAMACTGNMLHHQLEVKSLDGGKVEW